MLYSKKKDQKVYLLVFQTNADGITTPVQGMGRVWRTVFLQLYKLAAIIVELYDLPLDGDTKQCLVFTPGKSACVASATGLACEFKLRNGEQVDTIL